ncbi:glycosyltransferase [Microbacterium sp. CFBP9034]|uniref:glycosyltransferase n=1 Tax=Microbacterium sp. CFBP9034 TaxID=3096540 RepID=UPI002A6A7542|nr:glycosyltransferase [Microbacterium sp. CFBP9034]MDY0908992.1 glycosyltransferase [Microbacterium sp. CFBP9034]
MTRPSVWAVVTSFRPDRGVLAAVSALTGQVDGVVVVDDGSGPQADEVLGELEHAGVAVLRHDENRGIAAALNSGIRLALDRGAEAVVTFDQDSHVGDGFVAALVETMLDRAQSGRPVGPVVPEYFAGVRQVAKVERDGTLIARHAIQSGMLLDRGLLELVGPMREDLFIDLVDTEFELRCVAHGRPSVASAGLVLAHSLGARYQRLLFGRRVRLPGIPPEVTLSTPFRYYYRVRNRIVVNRAHWRSQFGWIARDSLLELVHFANALLLARPRRSLWRLYRHAVRDARRGAMGRMPDSLRDVASGIRWSAPRED